MIDIHSHILPEIDDGSRSIDESVEMILEAKEAGFDTIISTSHYMEDYYEADVQRRKQLIKSLETEIAQRNINVEILEGSEIYISENFKNLIKEKKASSLCESQYVLFEFPLNAKPYNMFELVFEIQQGGFVPILAHPERYRFIQSEPSILLELINRGVLMQTNFGSFVGRYGSSAKDLAIKMLKANMTHFLGTDSHRHQTVYLEVRDAIDIVDKIAGKEKRVELTEINPRAIIDNQRIDIEEPEEIKVSFKDKIKKIFK